LNTNEDEDITTYFIRVNEVVKNIKGMGDEINEQVVVQKVLRSLPMRFDSNISALGEREDISTLTMDELHGTLIAYEMITEQDNSVTKEATFKASKKTKKKRSKKAKSDNSSSDVLEDYEEVTNFVRKMKKGTDEYRGKISLIYFNCDGIGHFDNKFPHKKKKRNEEDESKREKIYKGKRTKFVFLQENPLTKEDSSSSNEDEVGDSDIKRVLFMVVEDSNEEGTEEEYE
jgi:hypothetical protein